MGLAEQEPGRLLLCLNNHGIVVGVWLSIVVGVAKRRVCDALGCIGGREASMLANFELFCLVSLGEKDFLWWRICTGGQLLARRRNKGIG